MEDCLFYHTMDLPGVGQVDGQWDLRGDLRRYLGGVKVKGKRCLDIGAASGFLSFEMEREGAEVVSFDADDPSRIHLLPIHDHPYTTDHEEWLRGTADYLRRLHGAYWFAYKALGSKNRVYHGDIYQLPSFLGTFDVVVLGQILVHLSNPVYAIAQAAQRSRDTLVIVEGTLPDEEDTVAKMHSRASAGGPPYIWWQYSVPLYRELLAMVNFDLVTVTNETFTCVQHEYASGQVEVTTMVANRKKDAADG